MADQTVTIKANVQTTGLDNAVNSSSQVHENLSASARAAQQLERAANNAGDALRRSAAAGGGVQPQARTTGGATGARAAAMAGSRTPQENLEYGQMRGVAGATGATARDFANQAQGLGGLVRLYATFAANVFAVSAAFGALKNAADTTNLIKGLDQLGARSGIALGQLAAEFSKATDGVVSLRDAAEVTAKATASGLSSKQVLEIAKVAKSASQALGVDALDAVNRLTRGITKLEPELLDELGIFTKIDPAVQEYARSLNKTAGALTDFERRQAFAVAALKEGTDKFGAIELDANPYSKLLASTKNVAQEVLELVNKALTPLVGLLASSPTALLGVITAIATILLKQAIPAVGEFRASLERSAQDAAERSKARQAEATAAAASAAKARRAFEENTIEALLSKQEEAEKRYENATKAKLDRSKTASKLLIDDISKVSDADIAAARAEADKLERGRKAYREQGKSLRELADSTEVARNAQKAYTTAAAEDLIAIEARKKGLGILALNQRIAEAAARDAAVNEIKSNAARTASLSGLSDAFSLASKQIGDSGLKGFDKVKAGIGAFTGALGGALSTVLRFASGFLGTIGIIAAVIGILDSFMDKSKEALAAFEEAANRADKATKHLGDTFRAIFKDDAYSVQAIQARANALTEQSAAMQQLTQSAIKAKEALTGDTWGRIKDTFASLFGAGVQKNFEKTLTKQLVDTIENLDDADIKEKLSKSIQGELQISEVSFRNIAAAIEGLDPASETVRRLNAAIKQTSVDSAEAASKATGFADGFKKGTQLFADLKTQFADKSPMTQWAIQSNQSLEQLAANMDGPIQNSIANLTTALTQMSKNPIFGPQAGARLLQFADSMREARDESKQAAKELDSVNRKIKEIEEKSRKAEEAFGAGVSMSPEGGDAGPAYTSSKEYQDFVEQLNKLRKEAAVSQTKQQKAFAEAERIRDSVAGALSDGVRFSAGLVAKTITAQIQKGATEFLQQYYAAFDTVPQFAGKIIELKIQEISNQLELIKTQKDLLVSQERLSATYNKVSAEEKVKTLVSEGKGPDAVNLQGSEEYQKAAADVKFYTESLKTLELVLKNPQQAMRNLSKETGNLTAQQIAQNGVYQQVATSVSGLNAQIAQQSRQIANLRDYEKPLAELRAEYKAKQELNDVERQRNDLLRQRLQLQMTGLDEIGKSALSSQVEALALDQARLEEQRALDAANEKYNSKLLAAKQFQNDADRKSAEETARTAFYREVELAQSTRTLKVDQAKLETIKQQTAAELQQLNQRFQLESNIRESNSAARQATLAIDKARLDAAISLNQYSDTYVAKLQYSSAIKDAENQKDIGRIQALADYQKASDELQARRRENFRILELDPNKDLAAFQRRQEAIQRDEALAESNKIKTLAGLDLEYTKAVAIAGITQQTALHQAKFNEELDNSNRLADALTGAFGEIGTKIGELNKALLDNTQTQTKNADTMARLQNKLAKAIIGGDPQERLDVEDEIAKQKKKSADDELKGNAKILASTKAMLKEKTGGYKILDSMEKATHVMRMTNTAIEYATKIKTFAMELAAAGSKAVAAVGLENASLMAKIPAYTAGIFAKITSQIGLPGPVVAAGIVAAIFAAFGGGKKSSVTGLSTGGAGGGYAASAEQQQKVQGTAFALDSQGKEVQVRRGVFGAEDEKSDAIRKSIEVIKETSVDGLAYYNGMLEALQSIDSAIGGAAKGLYGVQGLRTGSMFGTQEGTSGRSGFLGIGSKSITTEIKDSGLLIQGTFKDLAAKTNQGVLELYETVATTVKRGGFLGIGGGTSTSYSTKYSEVSQNISEFFSDVFTGGFELFKQVGKKAGYTEAFVEGIVGSVDVGNLATSLRGLKGEEFERELQAVISTAFSMASEQLFPQFIQFAKFGEDLTQTVIRVIDANEKVNQQLKNIGGSGGKDFFASEKLVNLFGGLSEFISKTNDFRDKFLTDAQRLAPITQAVTTEFDRLNQLYGLGLSTSMTREQFASITAASEGNETLYASLIKVSGGFDQVLTSLEAAAEKAEKASEKVDQLTESVLDYRNATTQLEKDLRKIRKTHTETIKELEELGQATQDNINLLAEYNKFQLLERIEQDIQKLYETRRSELDKTIDTLTQAKTRILDLRDSLLRGPQSTLTPVQKNVNLRTAYGTLLAQTTSALPEERELGRSKIVEIAQQYLQSSQEIYRSSQMYTMIYNQIISDLNTIYGDIEGELQNAKTDRRLLEESVNFLGLIKTNTENTAQKLTQLLNLYSTTNTSPGLTTTVQARATGGLASGVTLVGERGPELVDFRDPGRVYSANQTRGMFGMEQTAQYNQQMLAELRSLNEKIDCLEQVVAEGAVLNANATNKNTQQIVGAVVVNTSQTVESTRLQSRIVIK